MQTIVVSACCNFVFERTIKRQINSFLTELIKEPMKIIFARCTYKYKSFKLSIDRLFLGRRFDFRTLNIFMLL